MGILDETKEQWKKIKDRPLREKVKYFWDYYKVPTIVVITLVFVTIWIAGDMREGMKPTLLNVCWINGENLENSQEIMDSFIAYTGNNPEEVHAYLDTSLSYDVTENSMASMTSQQKLLASVAAGNLDIIIADEASTQYFASSGFYQDLRNILSQETLRRYQDSIYYYTFPKDSDTTDGIEKGVPIPIGIYCQDFHHEQLSTAFHTAGNHVLCVINNTKNQIYIQQFLDFLEN